MFWSCVLKIHLEYAPLQNKTTQRIRRVYLTNTYHKYMACVKYICANNIASCIGMGVLRKKITWYIYWKTGSSNMKSKATHQPINLSYAIICLDEMRLVGKTIWLFITNIQISLFQWKSTIDWNFDTLWKVIIRNTWLSRFIIIFLTFMFFFNKSR